MPLPKAFVFRIVPGSPPDEFHAEYFVKDTDDSFITSGIGTGDVGADTVYGDNSQSIHQKIADALHAVVEFDVDVIFLDVAGKF